MNSDQADSLRQALGKSVPQRVSKGTGQGCRVIAVTGGKGGVGKTNVAVNLSLGLCQAGARVLLLDADLGLANVDVLMGLNPQYTLQHLVFNQAALDQVVMEGPLGLHVLPGGTGLSEMANLNTLEIVRLLGGLRALERQHDFLVIDTAAGISNSVLRFLLVADDIVIVSMPEPPALLDAYGVLKALRSNNAHGNIYLLMNMVRSNTDGMEAFQSLNSVASRYLDLRLHYMGNLPQDPAVTQSVKQQRPFLLAAPQAPVSIAIAEMAWQFAQSHALAPSKQQDSFFARLLGTPR
jgi:flagellar biosynthesis protein FlhG